MKAIRGYVIIPLVLAVLFIAVTEAGADEHWTPCPEKWEKLRQNEINDSKLSYAVHRLKPLCPECPWKLMKVSLYQVEQLMNEGWEWLDVVWGGNYSDMWFFMRKRVCKETKP